MNDPEIRAVLLPMLRQSAGRVVEEWDVRGSRMDVVFVTLGHLWGYEIKSQADSLAKLEHQARDYSSVCDYCTLVAAPKHVARAEAMLPGWWGISVAENGGVACHRPVSVNPAPSVHALAWMLWCGELRGVLRAGGVERPPRGKAKLVTAVAESMTLGEFRRIALMVFLNRGPAWKGEKKTGDK